MPHKMWKHNCLHVEPVVKVGSPGNCSCGGTYEYDGWHNTRMEAMAWYQKHYGLKPIGIHRHYADQVLAGSFKLCSDCNNTGYLNIENDDRCFICPSCKGAGSIIIISPGKMEMLRRMILAKYPDAAAPSNIGNPSTGFVLHDLEHGEMVVGE